MSRPVALVLGAGPRVGASVAATFATKGYQVAIASRSGTGNKTAEGYLSVKADFASPSSVPGIFSAVKAAFQTAPSVVVYNAASLTPPPDANSVLSVPVDSFTTDLNINTVTPYVAAQEAVKEWETLPADAKKSFIYTGNILNVKIPPVPVFLNLGVGKSASAYWIGSADTLYAERGYRLVYIYSWPTVASNVFRC